MRLWVLKRQAVGLSIVALLTFGFIGWLLYAFATKPTCTDGRQNGDEMGVDCEGSCTKQCVGETRNPAVLWSRFFNVRSGVYDAGAMVENLNLEAVAEDVAYTFKLYDAEGVLLAEKHGKTFFPPKERTFIYEPTLVSGSRRAARVDFTIDFLRWVKFSEPDPLAIEVVQKRYEREETPLVRVSLANRSLFEEPLIEVYVLLERNDGTVYAASRTIIKNFPAESEKEALFTWPTASAFPAPENKNIIVLYRRGAP